MAIAPRHLVRLLNKYLHPDDIAELAPSLRKLVTRGDGAIPDDIVRIHIPPRVKDDPIITGLREKINVPRRTPEPDILQENFRSMMSDTDTADIITDMYLKEYPDAPGAAEALNEMALRKIRDVDDKLNALVRTPQGREIIGSTPDFRDLPPRSDISDLNRNLNRLRNEENKAYILRQILEGTSEFPNMRRMRVGDQIRDVNADARNWRLAESLAQGIKKTAINAPLLFLSNYLINRSFETPQEERVVQ